MAEGDVGGTRSGGSASRSGPRSSISNNARGVLWLTCLYPNSDAFNKREKANEDYYVKQKEKEKYIALLFQQKLYSKRI